MQRTPYDKTNATAFRLAGRRARLRRRRAGRPRPLASEGDWYTFKNESNDGYDTVEWAAALPYSNGKVGMFGGSYVGATQMLAAIAHPPHLAGIAPDRYRFELPRWLDLSGRRLRTMVQRIMDHGPHAEHAVSHRETKSNALDWKNALPLTDYPLLSLPDPKSLAPYFQDWLAHPNYDDYWKQISIEDHYSQIQVPVFTIAAWYDIFLGGSLRNYTY